MDYIPGEVWCTLPSVQEFERKLVQEWQETFEPNFKLRAFFLNNPSTSKKARKDIVDVMQEDIQQFRKYWYLRNAGSYAQIYENLIKQSNIIG